MYNKTHTLIIMHILMYYTRPIPYSDIIYIVYIYIIYIYIIYIYINNHLGLQHINNFGLTPSVLRLLTMNPTGRRRPGSFGPDFSKMRLQPASRASDRSHPPVPNAPCIGRNPAPVENGGKHAIILLGFQPYFWWCRISQPSTVYLYIYTLAK